MLDDTCPLTRIQWLLTSVTLTFVMSLSCPVVPFDWCTISHGTHTDKYLICSVIDFY